MNLADLSEPKLLVPRLLGDRLADVVRELTKRLESTGRISNSSGLVEAVVRRENDLSTVLMPGVAVPHIRGQAVRMLSLAIGLSERGVRWTDPQERVHHVFLFAVPMSETQHYLGALSVVTRLMQDEPAFHQLKASRQPEEMWRVLARYPLPEDPLPLQT